MENGVAAFVSPAPAPSESSANSLQTPTDVRLSCGQPGCGHPSFMHAAPPSATAPVPVPPVTFATATQAPSQPPSAVGGVGTPGLPGTSAQTAAALLHSLNVQPITSFFPANGPVPPRPITAYHPDTTVPAPVTTAARVTAVAAANTSRNVSRTRMQAVTTSNPSAPAFAMRPVRIVMFPLKVNLTHIHVKCTQSSFSLRLKFGASTTHSENRRPLKVPKSGMQP
jgi:hypothetical protein